jgi:Zn-dependent peptidase ImmA (M78 family)
MARGSTLHHSEAFLRKRLHLDRKSVAEVAKECNVSIQIIYKQMRKFGIK